MNTIELARWKPSLEDPRKHEYAGQPTAEEVFEELKYRLEGMGYLPDEYFRLDSHWEDGREIPCGADIFCTTDYGESEGVYLDVYLKWYQDGKPITKGFITGKTLGENGNDLDRMFLISSAITSSPQAPYPSLPPYGESSLILLRLLSPQSQRTALRGPHRSPAKRVRWGKEEQGSGRSFRRKAETELSGLCDDAGQRPLRMSDYDKAALAIRDGELDVFLELYPKLLDAHADDLLIEAAGRPGAVGRKMTRSLLDDVERFLEAAYSAACRKAIDISDLKKVTGLRGRGSWIGQASARRGLMSCTSAPRSRLPGRRSRTARSCGSPMCCETGGEGFEKGRHHPGVRRREAGRPGVLPEEREGNGEEQAGRGAGAAL